MKNQKQKLTADDVLKDCYVLKEEQGKLLTTKEAAIYLGLTEKTVRNNYRFLGGFFLLGQYRFPERSLINALQRQEREVA